ncbi:hypothetical protein [Paraburkholderia phytofirmans]|uniref:hypothetical protein n=1 Tax=Paraburkholderia phytofirmans TaxID=261302 RepID=UPI0011DF494B|nr:hypothetical protein [Paraburkholderia phytofirmans]
MASHDYLNARLKKLSDRLKNERPQKKIFCGIASSTVRIVAIREKVWTPVAGQHYATGFPGVIGAHADARRRSLMRNL